MEQNCSRVCVTGSSGYIGSALVKKLLDNGHTVHATLRNLDDRTKVGLLRSFPNAETKLHLFEADIYKPEQFELPIRGCEFVFHVAASFYHTEGHGYSNGIEATISTVKKIALSCIKSGTVRRLIYTASVLAASPLKDDGSGYKDSIDETCWTPLDLSFAFYNDFLKDYVASKTLVEKEILRIGTDNVGGLEVVTLACGLVGGETHLSRTPGSVMVFISQILNEVNAYQSLKLIEEVLGKVPIVHVEDVCRAHIFCMEAPSINGRFLCASSYMSTADIAHYYQRNFPEFHVNQEYLDDPKREIDWGGTKLIEKGFVYNYDTKMILDDCINCARRLGDLQL